MIISKIVIVAVLLYADGGHEQIRGWKGIEVCENHIQWEYAADEDIVAVFCGTITEWEAEV